MLQQRTIAVKSYNNNKDDNIHKAMVLKFVPYRPRYQNCKSNIEYIRVESLTKFNCKYITSCNGLGLLRVLDY